MRDDVKILVVDDTAFIRKNIIELLVSYGFNQTNITESEDGREAIKILDKSPNDFNLILSDMNMPHVNGTELLRFVRSNKKMEGQKIIMVTTESEKDIIIEALKLKPNGYILKTSLKDKLEEEVMRVLEE